MASIDPASPVPLYYQLKLLLEQQMEQGLLQPGDKIPTEAELCERYKISRTPVRQALLELTREGKVTRSVGRGTFVATKAPAQIVLEVVVPDARWQWPLVKAAQQWNRSGEGPQVTLQFNTVPLAQLHDHLSLAVARGEAPDISVLDSVWVAEFAHRRYLCSLAEIDSGWADEVGDDLFPALLRANSYGGQLYAVPTNADAAILWYRHDWFAAEGLTPPASWEALRNVARHFRQPSVRERYGLRAHPLTFAAGRAGGETTTYQLLPFLWTNCADLLEVERVVLDSPATRQALSFLRELVQEEVASPSVTDQPWDGTWRAFARGDVALAFGGTYENYLIQSTAGWDAAEFAERARFVPLPAGPQGKQATLVGGMTYTIYRQSQNAIQALELLKLALTPAILQPYSRETGQNPSLLSVTRTLEPDEDTFLQRTAQLFAQSGSRPSLPVYNLVSIQFQEMVELCLSGQMSVEQAVRRAAERIGGITTLPVV